MKENVLYMARRLPGTFLVEDVADYLGLPVYAIRWLVAAGHLKPLGRPSQNSVKRFAAVELEHHVRDREWLSKAVSIIERATQEKNRKAQKTHRQLAA